MEPVHDGVQKESPCRGIIFRFHVKFQGNNTVDIPLLLETPETNTGITEQVEPSETETIICQTMCFLGRLACWDGQICTWNLEWNILDMFQEQQLSIQALVLSQYFMPSKRLCIHHSRLPTLAMPRTALRPRQ